MKGEIRREALRRRADRLEGGRILLKEGGKERGGRERERERKQRGEEERRRGERRGK